MKEARHSAGSSLKPDTCLHYMRKEILSVEAELLLSGEGAPLTDIVQLVLFSSLLDSARRKFQGAGKAIPYRAPHLYSIVQIKGCTNLRCMCRCCFYITPP